MCLRTARDGFEVYMVRRSAKAKFVPDVFVYPGGAVDPEDASLVPRIVGAVHPDVRPQFVVAAIRESFEECGLFFGCSASGAPLSLTPQRLDAARRDLLVGARTFAAIVREFEAYFDASALVYFSHWVTPTIEPRRFDARFFVARAPRDQAAEADASETHDGRWIRPSEALNEYHAGRMAMIFPTIKHLERLAEFRSVDDVLEFARTKPVLPVTPDVLEGSRFVLPPELEGSW